MNFPTEYQHYIYKSRYARWIPELNRREEWPETVDRYLNFIEGQLVKKHGYFLSMSLKQELRENILNFNIMPSMRALMTAGPAAERDEMALYNCSYLAVQATGEHVMLEHDLLDTPITINIKHPVDFDEGMYILLCGTGLGFSVERQFISDLPTVGKRLDRKIYRATKKNYNGAPLDEISTFDKKTNIIKVHDSKYGWASALRILIVELYNGNFDVQYDISQLRPAGAPLKTFGGYSSGPEPLSRLFKTVIEIFKKADGRKLNSLEVHDIMCSLGECVVVGGVRRSAEISLSNLSDTRMRNAKTGNWWVDNVQRSIANNSVAYTEKPDITTFTKEWLALMESGSGERGIFNRGAVKKKFEEIGREYREEVGTNPCGEILLRSMQLCNLTEAVIRPEDTFSNIIHKVRLAAILGTFQSIFTDFKYVRKDWQRNCEEERLLGVSLTGIMDKPELCKDFLALERLREEARQTNEVFAKDIGINPSAAITCVKPSGTVSQLVDSSSGIHTRYSRYYIRRVRGEEHHPLTQFLASSGVPYELDVTNNKTYVFSFAQKSPEGSLVNEDLTAIEMLENWLAIKSYYCDHNPSCTIHVKKDEWLAVGNWVYEHFDDIGGLSFLPYSEHTYIQAPYEEISKEEYERMKEQEVSLDWTQLTKYEKVDSTTASSEFACTGNVCEVVDIGK